MWNQLHCSANDKSLGVNWNDGLCCLVNLGHGFGRGLLAVVPQSCVFLKNVGTGNCKNCFP